MPPGSLVFILLAVASGASLVVQQALNANLRIALSSAALSGFVSYFVGTLCMVALTLALRDPLPTAAVLTRLPWWMWSGGVFGAIYIGLSILLLPKLGATAFVGHLARVRQLRLARPRAARCRPAAADRRRIADRGCRAHSTLIVASGSSRGHLSHVNQRHDVATGRRNGSRGESGGALRHEVRLADHGIEHVGTYRIDGWMLEVTCCYGTLRVPLGLFEEKALARKLLKHLAQKAAREVADETPHPATIAATKTAASALARKG